MIEFLFGSIIFGVFFIVWVLQKLMSNELNEKQIATFFVCPQCKTMHKPKSFIDSKDKHINRLLMTCKSCSIRGYFELKDFVRHNCNICHNNIRKWHQRYDSISNTLNPCPHCKTYGATIYCTEIPETERGIQYSSKKNDKTIFILIIIAMIVLFLTLVN